MAIEEHRLRIRQSLEEKLGVAEAAYLMDRPPGGWSDLVTNHTLDLKFDVLDERFKAIDARFNAIDERFNGIDGKFSAVDDNFRAMEANLTLRIEASADRLRAEMQRDLRAQTWRLMTVLVAAIGSLTAIFTVITALVAG